MANNSGPIAQAAQALQLQGGIPGADLWRTPGFNPSAGSQGQRRRGVLESFGDMPPPGSSGHMAAYAPGGQSGGTGTGDGYLAHIARAMHGGRGPEIAAQADGGATDSAHDRGPGGGGAGYGQAMGGILGRMGQLVPTETPELKDDKWRQVRRLGLGMMAHGGPKGSGITGIGQAGLNAMDRNDQTQLAEIEQQQANREAQREHLGTWYDHLQGEREFATERADARADRQLERRRYESLDEYRRRQADTAARRADAYATKVGRGSASEREISDMIARGVPPGWAQDVARGNVELETDQFGNSRAINLATGEVRNLSGQAGAGSAGGQTGGAAVAGTSERQRGNVFGAVEEGTGPVAGLRAATNAVVGPFVEGAPFEDTATARAGIRNFAQEAKTALVNNPRFPVAEQQIVQELLPSADRFWTDPDAERAKLQELRDFLGDKISEAQRSMNSGRVTEKERGRLANQVESIERVLGLMGSPDQAGGEQLPQGVPQGSRRIGTLNGQPVYETPDGKRLVAE